MIARNGAAALMALGLCLGGCTLTPGKVPAIFNAPEAQAVRIDTTSGPIRGAVSSQGEAFLGIPFAAPPVGPLRFQPPGPVQPWQTVRDATKPGDNCIQASIPGAGRQSEDCLTLNVYAPSTAKPGQALPVMVWIYGGGFTIGDNVQYDLSLIAQRKGVIVVAPNYRLGAFGFLAHPALKGSGEGGYALQDQQAAFRWVQANIANFGGDPKNVTLFGESAGAWSVCYQLTAPGAQGLFQRAILESGACTSPDSALSLEAAEAGGAKMAAALGCTDPATAGECLRALPPKRLVKAKSQRRGLLGQDAWAPAFGGDVLPLQPRAAFEAGQFVAVPVIDGTNRDEGRLFLDANRLQGRLYSSKSYEGFIQRAFEEKTPQVLVEYAEEARANYGLAYADIVTDSTFSCPALTLNALLAKRTPVHAYEFDDPQAVFGLPHAPFTPPAKAFHSSEIVYVFQTRWAVADPAKFTPAQRELSDRFQTYWTAFARSGDPNNPSAPVWPADDGDKARGTIITLAPGDIAPAQDFARTHHCAFWNALGY